MLLCSVQLVSMPTSLSFWGSTVGAGHWCSRWNRAATDFVRITEVNVDVCRQAKPSMICEFLAPVPGQGFVQLGRQLLGLPDERGDDRFCIFNGPLTSITYRVWRSTKAAMWLFFDPDSRSPSQ